jgi:phosphoribosyl 1,2-cyclic phosphodiesterase
MKPNHCPFVVRFRGVRGSLPSPSIENMRYGGNTSCVEVRFGNQLLILDAGSGIRSLGEELSGNAIETSLLLSHTHWDHIQGLPFFTPGYLPHNRIRLFVAHGQAAHFHRALVNQMAPSHFPVPFEQLRGITAVTELSEGETTLGRFSIRTCELNHPGGCTGFRIQAGGASIAYLPDHEPYRNGNASRSDAVDGHRALVEFIRDVDLLILDTQYTTQEYPGRIGWGHGCLDQSVALAMESRARQFLLFHHDPSHDDEKIDEMVQSARELANGHGLTIAAATENTTVYIEGADCLTTPSPHAIVSLNAARPSRPAANFTCAPAAVTNSQLLSGT